GGRGRRPAPEVGLGEREADLGPRLGSLAVALAQLDQPGGDPAERVELAELDALVVGVLEAPADHVDQRQRRRRPLLQIAPELRGGDGPGLDGLDGDHVARARLGVTERQLTEDVTRPSEAEDHLRPAGIDAAGLSVAGQEDQDAIPGFTLVHQVLAAGEPPDPAELQQPVAVTVREQRQEASWLRARARHSLMLTPPPVAGSTDRLGRQAGAAPAAEPGRGADSHVTDRAPDGGPRRHRPTVRPSRNPEKPVLGGREQYPELGCRTVSALLRFLTGATGGPGGR